MLNTKQLPRPLRRAVSDVAASLPIPYVVTCAGMKLSWPAGHAPEPAAETLPAAPILCEDCGKPTNGHARWCGFCDPLAD